MPSYKADIAGGALKVYESRIVASLLLNNASAAEWRNAIEVENVLQKKSPGTAKRQASLIRARLVTLTPDLLGLVRDGSKPAATQAVFAAALVHSPLLLDFLKLEVRDHFRSGNLSLTRSHWRAYLDGCRERDPMMPVWSTSTAEKLGDSTFQILLEIGMLSDADRPMLQPVYYQPEVIAELNKGGFSEILRAMQAFI
ncbi:MAG: hypothetical protein CFE28_16225 [Alphaproteobacteria bacterium PA2]|nr:MAG: hypothetical protein CFE28_16225 [Alphaproteobacteria bacterium PA2]